MNKKKTEKVTTAHPKHKAHTDIVPIEETDNLVKTAENTPSQPTKTTKTEKIESSAQDAEKIETAAQARDADLLKENLINRQLENLWANGRKQLLNEPSRQSKK